MTHQEEIEALQAALRIERANFQELRRLVLAYGAAGESDCSVAVDIGAAYEEMLVFAKGVSQ